jgi:hypothetical protein
MVSLPALAEGSVSYLNDVFPLITVLLAFLASAHGGRKKKVQVATLCGERVGEECCLTPQRLQLDYQQKCEFLKKESSLICLKKNV